MPNWCITNYAVEGDEKDIKRLKKMFDRTLARKNQAAKSGFGSGWLGNLLKTFGKNWKEYACRGSFSSPRTDEENPRVFRFETETAWSRCDCVEEIIRERFPGVGIYFFEEEGGSAIFQTNDAAARFFEEQWLVESDDETNYFTDEQMIEFFSKLAGKPFGSTDEAEAWLDDYNNKRILSGCDELILCRKAEIVEE